MSPLVAACLAVPPAMTIGAVFGVFVALSWQRRAEEVEELTLDDREQLEAGFAEHASAVAAQVSEYADALADGDVLLRERLRRVELTPRGQQA